MVRRKVSGRIPSKEELTKETMLNSRIKSLGGKPDKMSERGKKMFLEKRVWEHPIKAGAAFIYTRLLRRKAQSIRKARQEAQN